MFCGWPNEQSNDWLAQRVKLSELPFHYVRKYHGYAFSWAVIFTFWYHPMENTYGNGFDLTLMTPRRKLILFPTKQTHVWLYAHFLRYDPGLFGLSKTSFESLLAIAARNLGMVPRILCCRHGRINRY